MYLHNVCICTLIVVNSLSKHCYVYTGLHYALGQYGVVVSALYKPTTNSAPIKVAIKKTKVCLCVHK